VRNLTSEVSIDAIGHLSERVYVICVDYSKRASLSKHATRVAVATDIQALKVTVL